MLMSQLLKRIEEEEAKGNVSNINDLSESLREDLESRVVPEVFVKGLEGIKSFLKEFWLNRNISKSNKIARAERLGFFYFSFFSLILGQKRSKLDI